MSRAENLMSGQTKVRDLRADLAICEAATPGPWGIVEFINNAQFIYEAREGWPYAIRRALELEEEVQRLRTENAQLLEALSQRGCGL